MRNKNLLRVPEERVLELGVQTILKDMRKTTVSEEFHKRLLTNKKRGMVVFQVRNSRSF
jgi:hypothetical protein